MILWLLIIILCSTTSVLVSIPLIRRYDNQKIAAQDLAIYQDQLAEVDRDQTGGTIDAPEAAAARAEIRRRLVAAEATTTQPLALSTGWKMLLLTLTAATVTLGSVGLYGLLGAPEIPSVSNTQSHVDSAGVQADEVIAKLKARLQDNPKDAEGWRMLGWAQFNSQHYGDSADAYAKALELDPTNSDYKSAYAESLVQTAQGIITPKAQVLIADVLAKNPKDFRARFYDALVHEQAGDQKGALDRWITLLADSPADAGWRSDVSARILNLGKATGRDVTTAIEALPAEDQQTMINAMVAKLADKLKSNPLDPDGWIKLIRSYQVLHDPASAKDALAKALSALANDPVNKERIIAAASELGVK